jgi:hypothetical protein
VRAAELIAEGRCSAPLPDDALAATGSYAEYTTVPEGSLARIPSTLPIEEAGGVPLVALTAWQVRQPQDAEQPPASDADIREPLHHVMRTVNAVYELTPMRESVHGA